MAECLECTVLRATRIVRRADSLGKACGFLTRFANVFAVHTASQIPAEDDARASAPVELTWPTLMLYQIESQCP